MKKLMIAAAIVCAAAFAQAAMINWESFGIMDINGDDYSGTALLHCVEIASISDTDDIDIGESFKSYSSDLLVAGNTYKFYFTSEDAEGNTFKSETVTSTMKTVGSASVQFTDGTWTPAPEPEPTPEPTSAMLMLLGMAGLALKRRRA